MQIDNHQIVDYDAVLDAEFARQVHSNVSKPKKKFMLFITIIIPMDNGLAERFYNFIC